MTDERREDDLEVDPFDGDYQPSLAFALTAARQAEERHVLAREAVEMALLTHGSYTNAVARSGAKAATYIVQQLAAHAERAAGHAYDARARDVADPGHDEAVSAALAAFGDASKLYADLDAVLAAIATPDVEPEPYVEPPWPTTSDWQSVVTRTERDVKDWATRVRGKTSQLLVLKPSPSAGKTESMITISLAEQDERQRVVFAARTKDVLNNELVPRIQAKNRRVRLHVITGRDAESCLNFENVAAVQAHGYAPGRAVCLSCDHHPRHAPFMDLNICPYYETRIRAQNDSAMAKRMLHEYPLILTTHAGLMAAFQTGGGMYGKFWSADLLLIDEDPTAAFEPTVTLTEKHCEYSSADPDVRSSTLMAAILRGAIEQAALERKQSERMKFKDAAGARNAIHGRDESCYAGRELHELLKRVVGGPVGQSHGVRDLQQLVRDVADVTPPIGAGALFGATNTNDVNLLAPPAGLTRMGEVLFTELSVLASVKAHLYRQVRGHDVDVSTPRDKVASEVDANVDMFDSAYQVRLEFVDTKWRFVVQDFTSLHNYQANIVVGDAYAHLDHYRQLFERPATKATDPAWVDPVTVVSHVAHFPVGSLVARIRTVSNYRYVRDEGWTEHAALLATLLRGFEGKRVLIYGHSKLREKFTELMDANGAFGIVEWAYEHWWSGRGKDQYRDFDAVVCISEPIQHVFGMLHIINARAFRDAQNMVADAAVVEAAKRIYSNLSGKHTLAHGMRNPSTHWRVRQEHERQNVNEQAQALHRVRGLMSPKTMVVIGQEIELTRDTLAATALMLHGAMSKTRGTRREEVLDGFLTSQEAEEAILCIEENLGVWSPAFAHALLATTLSSGLAGGDLARDLADQFLNCINKAVPGLLPSTLLRSTYEPPPYWELANKKAIELARIDRAHRRAIMQFETRGTLRPTWMPKSQGGAGYVFYSRRPMAVTRQVFAKLMNENYGPTRDGAVFAPHREAYVPF